MGDKSLRDLETAIEWFHMQLRAVALAMVVSVSRVRPRGMETVAITVASHILLFSFVSSCDGEPATSTPLVIFVSRSRFNLELFVYLRDRALSQACRTRGMVVRFCQNPVHLVNIWPYLPPASI